MDNQSLDLRKVTLSRNVKIAGGAVGCLVVAPLTFFILQGLLGVLAIAAAGVVAFTAIQLAPWYGDKVANWRMKLITAEAEANPIETMQNIDIQRTKELNDKDQYLEDWETEISNFDDELVSIKKEYPEEAPRYELMSQAMHTDLTEARSEQEGARKDLLEFEKAIKKAKSLYKIALAAQKVESFNVRDEAKVLQDIKTQVAFDSVRSNLNRSFARMNTAMAKRSLNAANPTLPPSALPARLGEKSLSQKAGA